MHKAIDNKVAQCYYYVNVIGKEVMEGMINTNKIKARLVELGYSQKDGADCIGVAQPTFSQKINNIRPMDLEEADRLANWLEIPDNEYGLYFFYRPSSTAQP